MRQWHKTRKPNIFWYKTKKGKRFAVRRQYRDNGKRADFNRSGFTNQIEAETVLKQFEKHGVNQLGKTTRIILIIISGLFLVRHHLTTYRAVPINTSWMILQYKRIRKVNCGYQRPPSTQFIQL